MAWSCGQTRLSFLLTQFAENSFSGTMAVLSENSVSGANLLTQFAGRRNSSCVNSCLCYTFQYKKLCFSLRVCSVMVHKCCMLPFLTIKLSRPNSSRMTENIAMGCMLSRAVSGLASNEEEESEMLFGENEEFCNPGARLVPWRNSDSLCDSELEAKNVNDNLGTLQESLLVAQSGVHLLEETDKEVLSERILVLSRRNKVKSATELFKSMELAGLHPNARACNSLLACLLRNGLLNYALRVFRLMEDNALTTAHTYSLVLKAVANTRGSDASIKMFLELEHDSNQRKVFDAVVYNTIIAICGRTNDWLQCERVWRTMKENKQTGTKVTYSLLISIFVHCCQSELAISAYSEMVRNGFKPNADVSQAAIKACTKEGKWDLGLTIFQNMLDNGIKPNLITCNALINLLGKAGKIELAFRVYNITKCFGHMPDVYTMNALGGALYRANRPADALHLFKNIMREQASMMNMHLYDSALMCCSKLGLWDRALQLVWKMETLGFSVSTASYNLVIDACEVARKPKVALQVYEHMIHKKCQPDTFTYLSLIRSCVWGSLWSEVKEILKIMPDASLYNAAIQGMCLRGKIDSAKNMYSTMRKKGLKPDGKTRALMLQNLWKN